jgi:hypothetical protein
VFSDLLQDEAQRAVERESELQAALENSKMEFAIKVLAKIMIL